MSTTTATQKLRGPEEFTDTVRALRDAFADLHYEEQVLDHLSRSEFEHHRLQMPYSAKRSQYRYQKICLLKQKAVVVV